MRGSDNDTYAYTVRYGTFISPSGVQGVSPMFWKTSEGGAGGIAAQAKTRPSV